MNDYLTIPDILAGIFWLLIIVVIGIVIRNNHQDEEHYRYFMPNLYFKIFFALAFAVYYVLIGGGDTTAYFDGALSLNSLFVKSPSFYFEQMTSDPNMMSYWTQFDGNTGFPPGWIYREKEAFFVCKVLSPIVAIGMRSYFATTIILAFIVSQVTWKLFLLVRRLKITKERYTAIALLFIPSVNFWCGGVSKDTLLYTGVSYIVYFGFSRLNKLRLSFRDYLILFFMVWMMYNVRSFVLLIILIPFLLAWISRRLKRWGASNFTIVSLRTVTLAGGFALLTYNLASVSEKELLASNAFLQQASVTQSDFQQNEIYTGKRYDIGTIEYTFVGLIRVAPAAIFAGTFRPVIWEALSPSLILNGLESIFLFIALIMFLSNRPFAKYNFIRRHEFLYFSLIFILLLAFVTGLTSVLFGVLVRLRAPLLPFLVLILLSDFTRLPARKRKGDQQKRAQLKPN